MKRSLPQSATQAISARLQTANCLLAAKYPGETGCRQPVHTVYGGAHLFKADSARRLGALALRALDEYAPNFAVFAKALDLTGAQSLPSDSSQVRDLAARIEGNPTGARVSNRPAWLAHTIYTRVLEKLRREPVEDFRIDFEDGYGIRPDAEEDGHAVSVAAEVAAGLRAGDLPPFIGIRIKPFSEELRERSMRTLDIFLTELLDKSKEGLPHNFVVTLPKITAPEQVAALADLFDLLENALALPKNSLKLEVMIETTQSIINEKGESNLPRMVEAARGRCVAAHFGTYDYTACCNITAAYQQMTHPACDFARHAMQVALAGTGIWLSDGATNLMPVPPHRAAEGGHPLSHQQVEENRQAVHRAWKVHFDHIQHSLINAFYQGWDLHPVQLPTRYAAVFAFFLDGLEAASDRLRNFVAKSAQATLLGDVFDDAATGQGLLNYFLRAINCGAISEAEALPLTGLTISELRSGSFVKILKGRRTHQDSARPAPT